MSQAKLQYLDLPSYPSTSAAGISAPGTRAEDDSGGQVVPMVEHPSENQSAGLIMRVWRTAVDPTRVHEYERFAKTVSLPMFRAQGGFLGVLFTRSAETGQHAVVTYWDGMPSISALSTSPTYQAAVRSIQEAGFLIGDSSIELFHVQAGSLAAKLFQSIPLAHS